MPEKLNDTESKALLEKGFDAALDASVETYLEHNPLAAMAVGYLSRRFRAAIREEVQAAVKEAIAALPAPAAVEKPKRSRKAKAEATAPAQEAPVVAQDIQGAEVKPEPVAEAKPEPTPVIDEADLPTTGKDPAVDAATAAPMVDQVPVVESVPQDVQESAPVVNHGVDYMRDIRPLCAQLVSVNAAAIQDVLHHFGVTNMRDVPYERLPEAKQLLEEAVNAKKAA